ncbi:HAD family hydrolase [Synechocystis sp. LKSZ1]|uniref:HAD family hydrolase n=1 Tax=Synechocystis sp. LKSZ1 TaxID=3144951 RepID=UPI00336BCFA6
MLRLITDFDGPIMDVSERYYRVYLYCLEQVQEPGQALHVLTKSDFWQLKRAKVAEVEIGRRSGLVESQVQRFADLRRQTVHTLPYLVHDLPHPGAVETLEYLQSLGVELVVMTMRRVCELEEALERNHLGRFFAPQHRYCLSNDYVKTGDTKDKPLLMQRAIRELPPHDTVWMVGDTEADILAAQSADIPVIGVLSGIRNQEQLERYGPLRIMANLREATEFILASVGSY